MLKLILIDISAHSCYNTYEKRIIMLDKNLQRLEFDKILQKLASFTVTDTAKEVALGLIPSSDFFEVEHNLNKTDLALLLITRKGNLPLENFSNIEVYLKNLESGNSISAKALLEIAKVLKISRNLHEYLYSDTSFDLSEFQMLCEIFNNLYSDKNAEEKIFSSIIDENTISDDASATLHSLRRNRKNLEQSVRSKLSDFLHSSTHSKYLMDNIITIRSDRFVIPVKEEYKDKVPGSILDISASGSTLYIEPSTIYDLNNKINNIKFEEAIEIEKILKNLSSLLFPIVPNIKNNTEIIYELDFIFAKAKYAKAIDGISPKINKEKSIELINARHPLINADTVVPIDFTIGKNFSTLLITGPNTGGKTATLKTVGLLEAMALSGLFIPAKEGSSIYVFDHIFADIGDEQSIQESLSTFSSHMINIVDILKKASSNSLILLDELGSGTDPVEGASLAISILEQFHNLGAFTVATTHYPELKQYALITDGFENASSDFDIENLKPTYKLLIGVPGKSNAFAISKALGLPSEILDRAKNFLDEDSINIENLLKEIYDDKLVIEKEKEKIVQNSNQIELLRKSLERDNTKLDEEAGNIIKNAKEKAREILLDAKDDANYIIRELEKENISTKEANLLRNSLNEKLQETINISSFNSSTPSEQILNTISANKLKIGDTVLVKKINQNATIFSLPNKAGELIVQIGIMKMNVNVNDLASSHNSSIHAGNSKQKSHNKNGQTSFNNTKSLHVLSEINIIGLNVDEAIPVVDKYLDDASLAGLETVRIVHGKGTGKLRSGIQSFLKTHTHVKSFRLGTFGEGEMGVTVVTLR